MVFFCLGSVEGSGGWEFIVAGGNAMDVQLGALQGQREAGDGGLVRWWKDFLCSLICFSKRTRVTFVFSTKMPPHRSKKQFVSSQ